MAQKYYLTDEPAQFTPTNFRGSWDDTAGAVTRLIDLQKNTGGAITTVSRAETAGSAGYKVCLYRGVSGPLAGLTIAAGFADCVIGVLESASDADFHWYVHAYVTAGDTDTVRYTVLADYSESAGVNEWPSAAAVGRGLDSPAFTTSGDTLLGDRLVVEIGYIARNATATSKTGTLYYGTQVSGDIVADLVAAGAAALGAGYLEFSVDFPESETVPVRVSQAGAEVFRDTPRGARVSQAGAEVARDGPRQARVSQVGVEVFRTNDAAPSAGAGAAAGEAFATGVGAASAAGAGSAAGEAFAAGVGALTGATQGVGTAAGEAFAAGVGAAVAAGIGWAPGEAFARSTTAVVVPGGCCCGAGVCPCRAMPTKLYLRDYYDGGTVVGRVELVSDGLWEGDYTRRDAWIVECTGDEQPDNHYGLRVGCDLTGVTLPTVPCWDNHVWIQEEYPYGSGSWGAKRAAPVVACGELAIDFGAGYWFTDGDTLDEGDPAPTEVVFDAPRVVQECLAITSLPYNLPLTATWTPTGPPGLVVPADFAGVGALSVQLAAPNCHLGYGYANRAFTATHFVGVQASAFTAGLVPFLKAALVQAAGYYNTVACCSAGALWYSDDCTPVDCTPLVSWTCSCEDQQGGNDFCEGGSPSPYTFPGYYVVSLG